MESVTESARVAHFRGRHDPAPGCPPECPIVETVEEFEERALGTIIGEAAVAWTPDNVVDDTRANDVLRRLFSIVDRVVSLRMIETVAKLENEGQVGPQLALLLHRHADAEATAHIAYQPGPIHPLDGNPYDMTAGEDYETEADR